MAETDSNGLSTVETSLRIAEAVAALDGARVSEVSDHLGVPVSTVHGHLKTLHKECYLTKEGDEYHIALQFLNRGGQARERKEGYKFAGEKVKQLAAETNERAQFVVAENGRGFYTHTESGKDAVLADARIGKRIYLHASAAGKSILAQLPERRVREIIDRWGLPAYTEHTITEEAELFEELEQIREQGYALNIEESFQGLHAVGASVETPQGQVLGAFSVSGPSNRLKGSSLEVEVPDFLMGVTNELELRLSIS
jgi:DNA-binding IclR family transcriptional regulator